MYEHASLHPCVGPLAHMWLLLSRFLLHLLCSLRSLITRLPNIRSPLSRRDNFLPDPVLYGLHDCLRRHAALHRDLNTLPVAEMAPFHAQLAPYEVVCSQCGHHVFQLLVWPSVLLVVYCVLLCV